MREKNYLKNSKQRPEKNLNDDIFISHALISFCTEILWSFGFLEV